MVSLLVLKNLKKSWLYLIYTRRYGPLRGPTSSSCVENFKQFQKWSKNPKVWKNPKISPHFFCNPNKLKISKNSIKIQNKSKTIQNNPKKLKRIKEKEKKSLKTPKLQKLSNVVKVYVF